MNGIESCLELAKNSTLWPGDDGADFPDLQTAQRISKLCAAIRFLAAKLEAAQQENERLRVVAPVPRLASPNPDVAKLDWYTVENLLNFVKIYDSGYAVIDAATKAGLEWPND